jgi:hypothetical protein
MKIVVPFKKHFIVGCFLALSQLVCAQNYSIILGRPTDKNITASVLFDANTNGQIIYGTDSTQLNQQSAMLTFAKDTPVEIEIQQLARNTHYYYKLVYRSDISKPLMSSPIYQFHTQREIDNAFKFTLESDEHLYDKKGIPEVYKICLENQAKDKPDFMLSLGDIFGDDHFPNTITSQQLKDLHAYYRPYLGAICHSIPFYICLGNHEGENDYYMKQNAPNNLCIMGTQWRKFYYPNPFPNEFYSGNATVEPFGIGNPENYYSWKWGNAEMIVLDVYRNQCDTSAKPKNWSWSLGEDQYNWLKNVLENSTAKFKFVFAHHVRGQGRGGVTNAKLFEWGGYEQDGTNYTFTKNRPNFAKPIHQLFKDNGVNIFFQGHDHVFAHEVLDGVTYQALPMAADSTYEIGMLANADAYLSDTIAGTGHLRVSVDYDCVKVDFVRTYLPKDTLDGKHKNGEIAFSYTVGACLANSLNEAHPENQTIRIYPNPTSQKITIDSEQAIEKIQLYSLSGTLIWSGHQQEIEVGNLAKGIYYIYIETKLGVYNKKLIIAAE